MNNTSYLRTVGVAIFTVIALPSFVLGQDKDKVVPLGKTGQAIGKIEKIERDQVTISVKGKTQTYKTNEYSKIVFDGEPVNLDRARDFATNRQFNQALEELDKIDMSKVSERVGPDVNFYKGLVIGKLALSGIGGKEKLQAAGALLAPIAAETSQSHHFYEAAEMMGDLALALGRPEIATKFYGELNRAPFPEMKALAFYKQGEVELTNNRSAEARKYFTQIASSTASDAEMVRLKNLAEVGLAICDAKDGKSEAALTKLEELVKKHDSTDQALFARIYNAEGNCYIAMQKPQQALLAFLKTDLLFSGSPELHAEALYQLTQLWPKWVSLNEAQKLVSD